MKKWFFIGLMLFTLPVFSQKKELTIEQSVIEQNRLFGADKLRMFQWIPGSDSYAYMERAEKTWVLKTANVSPCVSTSIF